MSWVVFTGVFVLLVLFDNAILHRGERTISFRRALAYTFFWISCAAAFCTYIYFSRGQNAAFSWATGYILEWMLSVDNLFVFHLVFKIYGTPAHLKHKPLFWGIVGAIIFRMIFFCIGEIAMHTFWWMHFIFAVFLIYTGIKAGMTDDEDEDPRNNTVFIWLSKRIPFVNGYDPNGAFFVRCKVNPDTGEVILPRSQDGEATSGSDTDACSTPTVLDPSDYYYERPLVQDAERAARRSQNQARRRKKYELRATVLVLVIICLELTDVLFAVDSVSAIIAQVPDLYLAYTACVFAMLGLRATFFVIDELVKMFTLLKYGVALTLIFIGVKLILKGFIHIPPTVVFFVLIFLMGSSMVLSVCYDRCWKREGRDDSTDSDASSPPGRKDEAPKADEEK